MTALATLWQPKHPDDSVEGLCQCLPSVMSHCRLYTKRQKTVYQQLSVSTHRNPARAEWRLDGRRVSDTVEHCSH